MGDAYGWYWSFKRFTFNFTNDALTSPSTYIDVMIIVSDGELTAQKNMTAWVTNTNDNPVLDLVGDKTVREGILTTFNLSANDDFISSISLGHSFSFIGANNLSGVIFIPYFKLSIEIDNLFTSSII